MKFFAERIDKECDHARWRSSSTPASSGSTYTDAIAALEKSRGKKFEFPVKWGIDLQTEHER